MRILVSGGTGFVGRFIVERLVRTGHDVAVLGRTPPPPGFFSRPIHFVPGTLDPDSSFDAAFEQIYFFVHAAFDHVAGRYRGGEGVDPLGFWRRNHEGSLALFEAARMAGVSRVVFLSSRAVYGEGTAGRSLQEDTPCRPETLYGKVKLATEEALSAMASPAFATVSLRATGVYGSAGAGRRHKWSELFEDYLAGKAIAPRVGTEVHGDDVAAAVELMLAARVEVVSGAVFNISDIVVDRHDILEIVWLATGSTLSLPERASTSALGIMATDRLQAFGWRPGGWPLLRETVEALAREHFQR